MVSLKECNGLIKRNLSNGHWNTEIFKKNYFFEKITPNFFNISDILGEKLKYFDFCAPQNSQPFRISEQKISVPVPVTYVSLHGPITLLEGHHYPLKKN